METHGVASYSLSYSIRDSKKDRHLQLYCSGSANESSCTSRIIARRTSTGNFKVTTVIEDHTCQEAEALEESEKRVDLMESQDSFSDEERSDNFDEADDYDIRSRRARAGSEDEWKGEDDGSESEDSAASSGSEDSNSSNPSTNSTRFKTTELKSQKGKEGKRSAVLTRFPPARDLRTEIAKLAIVSSASLFQMLMAGSGSNDLSSFDSEASSQLPFANSIFLRTSSSTSRNSSRFRATEWLRPLSQEQ